MSNVPAVHCEARKVSYRQTKDGLVVSFVVHPNDMPDALAVAPLGQRYMLALAAIGDDEQPVDQQPNARRAENSSGAQEMAPPRTAASELGKARYAAASDMEKALVRAARLPKDERFREWLSAEVGSMGPLTEDEAAQYLRDTCCKGGSRKLIAENRLCFDAFAAIETEYLIAAGVLAEPR